MTDGHGNRKKGFHKWKPNRYSGLTLHRSIIIPFHSDTTLTHGWEKTD
jgi:hypothetical protein